MKKNVPQSRRSSQYSFFTCKAFAEKHNYSYFDLTSHDWLFNHIFSYNSPRFYLQTIVYISILVIAVLVTGFFEGVLSTSELEIDMASDFGFWLIIATDYLLGISTVLVFRNFTCLYINILEKCPDATSSRQLQGFITRLQRIISHRGWSIGIYVSAVVLFYYQYVAMALQSSGSWHLQGGTGILAVSISSLVFIPLNLLHQVLLLQLLIRSFLISTVLIAFYRCKLTSEVGKTTKGVKGIVSLVGRFSLLNYFVILLVSSMLSISLYNNSVIFHFPMYHWYNIVLIAEFLLCSFMLIITPLNLLVKSYP